MKKMLSLLVIAIILCSLVACTGDGAQDSTTPQSSSVEKVQKEENIVDRIARKVKERGDTIPGSQ